MVDSVCIGSLDDIIIVNYYSTSFVLMPVMVVFSVMTVFPVIVVFSVFPVMTVFSVIPWQ